MRAVDFPEANIDLVKPSNMTDEECYSLRAMAFTTTLADGSEIPAAIVKWEPSREDLEALLAGRGLYMKQVGGWMPAALFTLNEKGESNDL